MTEIARPEPVDQAPDGRTPLGLVERAYRDAFPVTLRGGPVSVVRRGQGTPVVLVHGIPLSLLTWRHTLDTLARYATVVALDLRGFGMSAKPAGTYGVVEHARVVRDLLDALQLAPAAVVGSSYGAAVALTLASEWPEQVTRLLLVNPVCYPGGRHGIERFVRIGLAATCARRVLRHSTLGRACLANGLRRSYVDRREVTPELVDAYYGLLTQAGGERSFVTTLQNLSLADVARRAPRVVHPVLIVRGDQDRVVPASHADRLAEDIPQAVVRVLPGGGHLAHEEESERVNQLIAQFLAIA